jgi:5-methylcytosine-specific restriction endonuclease McrA
MELTPGMFQSGAHYRAWLAGTPIRTERPRRWRVPARWRASVMQHCHYQCQWAGCGTREHVTIEHIIPVVLGGSNEPSNLTVFCTRHQQESWARMKPIYDKAVAA